MAARKKKKCIPQFSDEFIDSTAPVKKIFDNLFYKNCQANELYKMVLNQREVNTRINTSYHHTLVGHPLYAFHEEWDGDLKREYFENFDYKSLMPYFITPMVNSQQPDPLTQYMRTKQDWLFECQKFSHNTSYTTAPKYERLNDEVIYCPKMMVEMAALVEKDPDPYFDAVYNWYYGGNGNLQLITINEGQYLLHSELHCSYITEFSKNDISLKKHKLCCFDCGPKNNILETIFYENIVVLRTMKKIFIVKVTLDDDKLEMKAVRIMESEKAFTGINFDSYHKNILYVSCLDNKFKIVNLDRMSCRTMETENQELLNNWNTVIGNERMTYMLIDRSRIVYYDKRTNTPAHRWEALNMITDEKVCHHITSARGGADASLYFTSEHHLFLADLRHFGDRPRVAQRWTHGMQCAPTSISTCDLNAAQELVCLSSQWCEDMCVLPNYKDRLDVRGASMPYRPPSILSVLAEAREKRLCWDFYNLIEKRLCTTITGMLLTNVDEKFVVLMQNSLGDITTHVIYPEYMEAIMEEDSVLKLQEWSLGYRTFGPDKIFEVSEIRDVSSLLKKMKHIPDDHIILGGTKCYTNFQQKEAIETLKSNQVDSALLDAWEQTKSEM